MLVDLNRAPLMQFNRFAKRLSTLRAARIEFQAFANGASARANELMKQDPRFQQLNQAFAFFQLRREPYALQFDLGNRPTPFETIKGAIVSEKGPTLSYGLAPTGEVVTLLYPAKSDIHRAKEDCIALRIRRRTAYQMTHDLRRDLRDMVTYCLVTSIGCEATILEHLRIRWLRWKCGKSVGGSGVGQSEFLLFSSGLGKSAAKTAAKFLMMAAFFAALPFIIATLVLFDFSDLGLKLGAMLNSR